MRIKSAKYINRSLDEDLSVSKVAIANTAIRKAKAYTGATKYTVIINNAFNMCAHKRAFLFFTKNRVAMHISSKTIEYVKISDTVRTAFDVFITRGE